MATPGFSFCLLLDRRCAEVAARSAERFAESRHAPAGTAAAERRRCNRRSLRLRAAWIRTGALDWRPDRQAAFERARMLDVADELDDRARRACLRWRARGLRRGRSAPSEPGWASAIMRRVCADSMSEFAPRIARTGKGRSPSKSGHRSGRGMPRSMASSIFIRAGS